MPRPRGWAAAALSPVSWGGLLLDARARKHKHMLLLAAEGTGDTLALLDWVAFGAVVVGQSFESFSWQILFYALLSLTVVRMFPVFLVLRGLPLQPEERLSCRPLPGAPGIAGA
jgi:sodium/hydrogen antiporter